MELLVTLSNLPQAIEVLLANWPTGRVLALHGSMGMGKTTLTHAAYQRLGVTDAVASPTYSLVNEYASPEGPVYHIDLYRIDDPEEAIAAGIEDVLFSGCRVVVEWPEKAPELLPDDALHLYISWVDEKTRKWLMIP